MKAHNIKKAKMLKKRKLSKRAKLVSFDTCKMESVDMNCFIGTQLPPNRFKSFSERMKEQLKNENKMIQK